MNFYIQGIGSISPQLLNKRGELPLMQSIRNEIFECVEPDFKEFIQPNYLRRMSKAVKYGIATALTALKDAGITTPDVITVGTAYGCLKDTEQFLSQMIENNETLLTPTSFIQSTHNTVSGQIALLLACHGHNFTFVQKAHSFEFALEETMMWLMENPDLNILCGGIDERTKHSHQIISRFGTYKNQNESIEDSTEGTIGGEGANFFILSSNKNDNSYAKLKDVYRCNTQDIENELCLFLGRNNLTSNDIDICMIGTNGDIRYDKYIEQNVSLLHRAVKIQFKKWAGEYPTVVAFAVSLSANILCNIKTKNKFLFQDQEYNDENTNNILIYNHYKNQYHSFILLEKI